MNYFITLDQGLYLKQLLASRATRSVCEKIAKNAAQAFFCQINTLLLPTMKNAARN
jgi:hypothetical protein